MEDNSHILFNNLLYSCVDKKQRSNESFVMEHAFGYILEGEVHQRLNDGVRVFKQGTVALVRRNQLIKSEKIPAPNGEFRAINIFFEQDFLRRYRAEKKMPPAKPYIGNQAYLLPPDPFIKGYFDSLIPYFEHGWQTAPPSIAELKTREAIELLLKLDQAFYDFLFDFSEPYKIDLEAYMNQHFMFNVPTIRFAQLTGRSLASFKRDFEKVFQTTPGQWLKKRRLQEAYYLIKNKGVKPSVAYLDVGFENLSHFSLAFKQAYGINPSAL